jgi:hypothetical protein
MIFLLLDFGKKKMRSDDSEDRQGQQQNSATPDLDQELAGLGYGCFQDCRVDALAFVGVDAGVRVRQRVHYPEPDLSRVGFTLGKKDMRIMRV